VVKPQRSTYTQIQIIRVSELPNMETSSLIKYHNDNIKMAKQMGDSESEKCARFEMPGPLTVWRCLLLQSGGSSCSGYL